MDGVHDMGGVDGFGPVVTPEGDATHHESWEVRAQAIALVSLLGSRDAVERLEPATYLNSSYYERWLRATESVGLARGVVTTDDLTSWRDRLADDPSAMPRTSNPDIVEYIRAIGPHHHGEIDAAAFAAGDQVRVRRMRPEEHHRCPRYLRGVTGRVEKVLGADPVLGSGGEVEPCYTVAFASTDLFGPPTGDDPPHTLLIDLWERYLEEPT